MANLLARLFGLDRPASPVFPTPDTRPVQLSAQPSTDALPPLKNWSHPFKDKDPVKDKRNPLLQLTHLAKAEAGYFPLGRSGLWHGGVHFDSGTADTLDQSSVQCLADGEVVAYRIDTQAPTTTYFVSKQTVEKPFSRNFVLVRHRLQPPKLEGSPDSPPSLIFYSLYMHLRDWSVYREDATLARPAFWPEGPTRHVKQTVNDVRPGNLEERGLNVRIKAWPGKVIDLLPRGAEVTVSGEGDYRKLENSLGPAKLINADGSIAGYLAASLLKPVGDHEYRITSSQEWVNVRAEPSVTSEKLLELPVGTVVRVSGEGEFRKLERVNQYVHFDSLEGAQEPLAADRVVVLDSPVPIKAGALIGHLGKYQDGGADHPEEKLHLEVFSNDDVDLFIEDSRAWAQHIPDKDRTWLKFAKGTAVVPHQENVTAAQLKVLSAASPLSAADLLVPQSVLDELPADRKIQVAARESRNASNWYRLDGLLHDAGNQLLNGWVREEVGVTPWLSPWSWEGYDIIDEYDVPQEFLASFLRAVKRLSEAQLERFGPMADEGDTGPLKTRLYDIIDANRDGRMTAEELRTAISLPAHAQSISQLIVNCESEWYHKPGKWDRLDEVLGHSGSTPHLNWLAEKQRIRQMCWWGEVAAGVGLPAHGEVYYFHPVGLVSSFFAVDDQNDLRWLTVPYGQLTFDAEGNDIEDESHPSYRYFSRVAHWPGGVSGVTIGRGYDLGQRPNPRKDLYAVGIEEPLLTWLIGAKGLHGTAAKNYIDNAPMAIRKHRVSRKQQYELFLPVYDYMKKDVVRISSAAAAKDAYGVLVWGMVNSKIQDIVIDLIYRGDYTTHARTFIQKPFVESDIGLVRNIMSNKDRWSNVPDDRFKRRAEYIKQ
ncbi:hypothetical protein PS862_00100 [Pseudomonas fluorescens]|uniref:Pesticin C-terminal domain-containing protein n=1 Tax=Pseudomonas fluorescens TaxID=294 RepID=A0A5E7G4Z9_PSEFL|nr:pesticin C-terminus-like muramidase [Pseudomonas fluorescens]VVO46941.1 hypothetical protein PS862_00100 [Pseudomonas fluorescens]